MAKAAAAERAERLEFDNVFDLAARFEYSSISLAFVLLAPFEAVD